jgi:hypothetical protein
VFEIGSKPKTMPIGSKRNTPKENKIKIESYMSIWPHLQILTYAIFTLLRWFENINKLNILLNEPKTITFESKKSKTNKNKNKNQGTYDNGHFCKYYQDAYFEPLWFFFSKPNTIIFLSGSQVHIKVSKLVWTNLAESFSNAYNKQPK